MLRDLVEKNRSYRGFDESRKVTREELLQMVDVARLVPSGANLQPLRYRLVFEAEEVKGMNALTRWAKALKDMQLPHPGKYPTAYICVCDDLTVCKNPDACRTDVGIAAQTILLQATEQGLGGCMLGNFDRSDVKALLGLPEHLEVVLLLAIGKPDEEITLCDVQDGQTNYWRDGKDVHYVPKRTLEDIVIS